GPLVVLPAAADHVAAGDALDRHRAQAPHHHRTLLVQRRVDPVGQYVGHGDAGQVVGNDVLGAAEPEVADLAQHLALARDRVGQYHVEGAEPVGGDHQQVAAVGRGVVGQAVGGDVEHVADLAAVAQRQPGQYRLGQGPVERLRGQREALDGAPFSTVPAAVCRWPFAPTGAT